MTKMQKPADQTAESITQMLTDDLAPGLAAMVAKIQAAEAAYSTTPPIRARFDDREAEDGIASLRHYLEHAAAQVRRILAAQRCPPGHRRLANDLTTTGTASAPAGPASWSPV